MTESDSNIILDSLREYNSCYIDLKADKKLPHGFNNRNEADIVIEKNDDTTSEIYISVDVSEKENIYCIELLNSILGEGIGSKLSFRLREELGLTNEAFTRVDCCYGFNRLRIELSTENNNLKEVLKNIFAILKDMKSCITTEDIAATKIFYTGNKKMLLDDSRELNFVLGYYSFLEGRD